VSASPSVCFKSSLQSKCSRRRLPCRVRPFGADVDLDCDDPKHMQWLFEASLKRAQAHGIEGVTLKFTQGVAKRIIPAIAATNAIVAAACANEVLKLATAVSRHMSAESGGHYMMYQGGESVYTDTLSHERNKDCPVCSRCAVQLTVPPSITVAQLIEMMKEDERLRLKNPAISVPADTSSGMRTIYNPHVSSIHDKTKANLDEPVSKWVSAGGVELTVDDPIMATQKQVKVLFA
jgi:ubiquitin-activating enzyme E1 C